MILSHQLRRAWRAAVTALSLASIISAAVPLPATAAVGGLTEVGSGFSSPLYVTHAGDARLFVVEQRGRIWILEPGNAPSLFLDLSGRVSQSGSERGLLGLAFHPSYSSNRLFYVNYTRQSDGATVIGEYRRSAGDADLADPHATYNRTVLTISQPYANHNGGWIGFKGSSLYIATGDGGNGSSAGDPGNRAQNKDSLLGKILRINPLDPPGAAAYSIPGSNPFVGRAGRDEVWAYGLRNPWRCSFDRANGKLWCADVGHHMWEEVNRSKTGKGLNYGWRVLEGRHCYNPSSGCSTGGKTMPIAEYAHTAFGGGNCAVTGGYVARRAGAALYGRYIFGDYCSGRIWDIPAGHPSGDPLPAPFSSGRVISSFGEGNDGTIYLTDLVNGKVYKVSGT